MIKKLLVIIALFSAPHMIQPAERKTPPTDKAQPKSGSFQRRPRSAAAQTQPTPPTTPQANQPQMLERHQSGDLSALIASYREAEGTLISSCEPSKTKLLRPLKSTSNFMK